MSIILPDKRCLFLHIPRTGGWWVRWAIADSLKIETGVWVRSINPKIARSHALLSHYIDRPDKANFRSAFAFVRHPIAYYESVWMFFAKMGLGSREKIGGGRFDWHPHRTAARLWVPDFGEWMGWMIRLHPGWYSDMIRLYVGPKGGEYCKFIGRTEHLPDHLLQILRGYRYKIPTGDDKALYKSKKKNTSYDRSNSRVKVMLNWTSELKDEVLETEREVIDRFYGKNENKIRMY